MLSYVIMIAWPSGNRNTLEATWTFLLESRSGNHWDILGTLVQTSKQFAATENFEAQPCIFLHPNAFYWNCDPIPFSIVELSSSWGFFHCHHGHVCLPGNLAPFLQFKPDVLGKRTVLVKLLDVHRKLEPVGFDWHLSFQGIFFPKKMTHRNPFG